MRVIFTAWDGGKCFKLISDKNYEAMKKKYPDLEILQEGLIPNNYD